MASFLPPHPPAPNGRIAAGPAGRHVGRLAAPGLGVALTHTGPGGPAGATEGRRLPRHADQPGAVSGTWTAWTYAPPILAGLGVLALLGGLPLFISLSLAVLSSLGLIAVFVLIVHRQPALFNFTMLIGAVAWSIGSILALAGQPVYRVVYWWAGFLVLTIVGERVELSRLRRLTETSKALFLAAAAIFLAGLALTSIVPDPGVQFTGVGMLALALWLLRYNIARRTVRQKGLTRYIAVCMLAGYVWLGLSGLLALLSGPLPAGPRYDALLHTLFLGFVFGMIFGHAPIILPAVLKVPLKYEALFYAPLLLLEISLMLRVIGDLLGWFTVRQWGGMLNVLAVLVFMFFTARAVITARSQVARS